MWSLLPVELWSNVLAHLPAEDLLGSASRVCRAWRAFIHDPARFRWKKTWARLRAGRPDARQPPPTLESLQAAGLILRHQFANRQVNPDLVLNRRGVSPWASLVEAVDPHALEREMALPWLMNYAVASFDPSRSGQFSPISRHPRYPMVRSLVWERFPEFWDAQRGEVLGVVAVMLCAIMAADAHEVRSIIACLLDENRARSSGPVAARYDAHDVLEFMYCLAYFFQQFTTSLDCPVIYAYQISQGIRLYEHSGPARAGLASTPRAMSLTNRQGRLVRHPWSTHGRDLVCLRGFPGTGKTRALMELCAQNPGQEFLILTANPMARHHWVTQIPGPNITVDCVHDFLLACCEDQIPKKIVSGFTVDILETCLAEQSTPELKDLAQWACLGVRLFFHSLERFVTVDGLVQLMKSRRVNLTSREIEVLSEQVANIWFKMCNPWNGDFGLPQEGLPKYVSLFRCETVRQKLASTIVLLDDADGHPKPLIQLLGAAAQHLVITESASPAETGNPGVAIKPTHVYQLLTNHRSGPSIGLLMCSSRLSTPAAEEPQFGAGIRIGHRVDEISYQDVFVDIGSGQDVTVVSASIEELLDYILEKRRRYPDEIIHGKFLQPLNVMDLASFAEIIDQETSGSPKGICPTNRLLDYVGRSLRRSFVQRWKTNNQHELIHDIGQLLDPSPSDEHCYYTFATLESLKGLEFDHVIFYQPVLEKDPGRAFDSKPWPHLQDIGPKPNLLFDTLAKARLSVRLCPAIFANLARFQCYMDEIIAGDDIPSGTNCISCKRVIQPRAMHIRTRTRSLYRCLSNGIQCTLCSSGQFPQFQSGLGVVRSHLSFIRFFVGPLAEECEEARNKMKRQFQLFM